MQESMTDEIGLGGPQSALRRIGANHARHTAQTGRSAHAGRPPRAAPEGSKPAGPEPGTIQVAFPKQPTP